MSKGKKAKPAKKGSAKSKKPARSKKEVAEAGSASAPETEVSEETASEEGAGEEETDAEEVAAEGAEAAASDDEAAQAEAGEGDAPQEVAAAEQEAAASEEPAAIAADEAVATAEGAEGAEAAGGDDDVPVEPKGPDTPVAQLPRPDQKRLVESLVFVSDRAINAQQLGKMLKIKSALAKELADELIVDYEGRGIELVELSGGYQFRSAPSSAHVVRENISQPPVRLTRAQLETLALVAYRQPITRPEIDDVRGVDSGSALRVLLERGLLKMLGRKDEPGRPLLYGTTPFFLDFFGMKTLKDLPTLREFTELSEENRALFKRKTGETIEEAEAALLAAEEAAQRDSLAAPPSTEGEGEAAEPPPSDQNEAENEAAQLSGSGGDSEAPNEAEPTDHDLEVEAETFAAGSLQTSPDNTSRGGELEDEEPEEQELPQAPEA